MIQPLPNVTNDFASVPECSAKQFVEIISSVREAISIGIYPIRIQKGSSGSYFCRNTEGTIVGVFKPKDEEVHRPF
jgi:hypothetical protein